MKTAQLYTNPLLNPKGTVVFHEIKPSMYKAAALQKRQDKARELIMKTVRKQGGTFKLNADKEGNETIDYIIPDVMPAKESTVKAVESRIVIPTRSYIAVDKPTISKKHRKQRKEQISAEERFYRESLRRARQEENKIARQAMERRLSGYSEEQLGEGRYRYHYNPTALIGIMNPKIKGGEKNMAKHKKRVTHHLGMHRLVAYGSAHDLIVPRHSRLARPGEHINPRHYKHHHNPLPNMDWKDIAIVAGSGLAGLFVGITGPGYLSKISSLSGKTTVNELITVGIGALLGYGTYKLTKNTEAAVVIGVLPALTIGMTEAQAKIPSIFPSWTAVAATSTAAATPAVASGTSGINRSALSGVGNVVPIKRQIGA